MVKKLFALFILCSLITQANAFEWRMLFVRAAQQGISLGLANSLYGQPPSLGALGPNYAASRGASDVWGALVNGYGPFSQFTTPQIPVPWIASTTYYINDCVNQTVTGCTTGGVITVPGIWKIGDPVSGLQTIGGIVGLPATSIVTAVGTGTITVATGTLTGAYTSGGTIYASRRGWGPGSDSNSGLTTAAPLATINQFINTTAPTAGDCAGLCNDGIYLENNSGRLLLNRAFTQWVSVESYSGNPADVTIENASAQNGVIDIRGTSEAKIQFRNLTVTPTTQTAAIYSNPATNSITSNGLHFFNCNLNGVIGSSTNHIIQVGTQVYTLAVSGAVSGGSGSNIVIPMTSTGILQANDNVTFSGTTGVTITGGPGTLNTSWTIAAVVPNTSISLANSSGLTASGTVSGNVTVSGADAPASDWQFVGCTFFGNVTITGTSAPDIISVTPTSAVTQPYSNFGLWNCKTAIGSTFFDYASNCVMGINGYNVVGCNFLINAAAGQHGLSAGTDVDGVNYSGYGVCPTTNVYFGSDYVSATGSNAHGILIGQNVFGAVVEYCNVNSTLQGFVAKGCQNVTFRNDRLLMNSGCIHGFYPKAAINTSFLGCLVYDNQPTSYAFFESNDPAGLPGSQSNLSYLTTLQGNWLVTDGAASTTFPLYWGASTLSAGGGVADYNIYDLRAASTTTWGVLRSGAAPTNLTSLQSVWGTAGVGALSVSGGATSITGGNGSNVVLVVASSTGVTASSWVYVNGGVGLLGYYQVAQITSTTIMLANTTALAAQSGTATIQYQFADALNDVHSQINSTPNSSAPYGTRNDVYFVYGTANKNLLLYCELVNQYGYVFNGLGTESRKIDANGMSYEPRYARYLMETSVNSSGTYTCPLPFNLPSGNWTVVIKRVVGLMPNASDPTLGQQAIAYGS